MSELLKIQQSLKVPKAQRNTFGKYQYRSCEDILESLKAPLKENDCYVVLSDEMVLIGDRYYIKSMASLKKDGKVLDSVTAYARESLAKKGMDDSQITGTASSYARKYALNGLFAIDDTKDADSNEHQAVTNKPVAAVISQEQWNQLSAYCVENGQWTDVAQILMQDYRINSVQNLPASKFNEVMQKLT
jgi:hypothetical protein